MFGLIAFFLQPLGVTKFPLKGNKNKTPLLFNGLCTPFGSPVIGGQKPPRGEDLYSPPWEGAGEAYK